MIRGVLNDLTWDEKIIFRKRTRIIELPEDVVMYMMDKHKYLKEFIEKLDLDLET